MAGTREILDRMESIRETMKVTNAMYLISSSKIRKAKQNMLKTEAYFNAILNTIGQILARTPELEHRYLEKPETGYADDKTAVSEGKRAYLIITADKGLAGAYNLNVIRKAEDELKLHPDSELFVIGQVGLHHFTAEKFNMREDFKYSSQNPTMGRARGIAADLLDEFESGNVNEIYVIYTRMKNALQSEAVMMKLMPLSREAFKDIDDDRKGQESFYPDAASVFTQIAPLTMQGVIFSALTESYCAELNDRMAAMDSASDNAADMLNKLELEYNRKRQGSITQEITEIIAGARAQRSEGSYE